MRSVDPLSTTQSSKGTVVGRRLSRQARVSASWLWTTRTTLAAGLALGERDVLLVRQARVVGARPDQPVIAVLLQDVRRPAGDAAHGEDRRELVRGDAHRRVGRARVEIHVGEDLLLVETTRAMMSRISTLA